MSKESLKVHVKKAFSSMSPAKRRYLINKKVSIKFPIRAENRMNSLLKKIFTEISDKTLMKIENTKHRYTIYSIPMQFDTFRNDDFASEIDNYIKSLEKEVTESIEKGTIAKLSLANMVSELMVFVKQFNVKEVDAYFKTVLGFNLPYTEEWWQTVQTATLENLNARLVGTTQEYFQKVNSVVFQSIRNEESFEQLVANIKKLNGSLTTARAMFIARDITGTLNSQIARNIQTSMGMEEYNWRTQYDERVRGRPGGIYPKYIPSHWLMDDKVCKWNNPSIVTLDFGKTFIPKLPSMPFMHPGEDWACRCVATPWITPILKEVDSELRGRN